MLSSGNATWSRKNERCPHRLTVCGGVPLAAHFKLQFVLQRVCRGQTELPNKLQFPTLREPDKKYVFIWITSVFLW